MNTILSSVISDFWRLSFMWLQKFHVMSVNWQVTMAIVSDMAISITQRRDQQWHHPSSAWHHTSDSPKSRNLYMLSFLCLVNLWSIDYITGYFWGTDYFAPLRKTMREPCNYVKQCFPLTPGLLLSDESKGRAPLGLLHPGQFIPSRYPALNMQQLQSTAEH